MSHKFICLSTPYRIKTHKYCIMEIGVRQCFIGYFAHKFLNTKLFQSSEQSLAAQIPLCYLLFCYPLYILSIKKKPPSFETENRQGILHTSPGYAYLTQLNRRLPKVVLIVPATVHQVSYALFVFFSKFSGVRQASNQGK